MAGGLVLGLLMLTIYTDRNAFLPGIGYLLFLLRFANRAQERRAVWFALPATILPALLFLPYFLWANQQVNLYWPVRPAAVSGDAWFLESGRGIGGNEWLGCAIAMLLLVGFIGGLWATFRPSAAALTKSAALFCVAGGAVSTAGIVAILDTWLGQSFSAGQILWTAPAAILLFFAALEWLANRAGWRVIAPACVTLLVVLCAAGDFFTWPALLKICEVKPSWLDRNLQAIHASCSCRNGLRKFCSRSSLPI